MAHLEFRFINLTIAGKMVDQPISVDCWRATIIFLASKSSGATIDGVPWDFLVNPDNQTRYVQRIELGGLIVDGKPVNIKHDLRFNTTADKLVGILVLQYYVEDAKH